jgi:hypothetical protein
MLSATPPAEVKFDLTTSMVGSGSTTAVKESGTAASFFQQLSTIEELDDVSSTWRNANHDGPFLVAGNLGRWCEASLTGCGTHKLVKQAEADAISIIDVGAEAAAQHQRLPFSSSYQPSKVLLETRSSHGRPKPFRMQSMTVIRLGDAEPPSPQYFPVMHILGPPPSSRPPLAFDHITLKPQRAAPSMPNLEEKYVTHHDLAPPRIYMRMPSLLDCVEIQAALLLLD